LSQQSKKSYNNHPIWILPPTKEIGRANNALLASGQLATIDSQNGHVGDYIKDPNKILLFDLIIFNKSD